ncbi:phosphoglycerate dehydrogenase [Taklimakanibacter lacteus]|uniref:phosphoglycerate dehydrogenase n=1 Tax=Taklimakanibacter lacteus TaxID=2268456 RepID=UPI000E660113
MSSILVTPRSLTEAPHPAVEELRRQGFDIVYSTAGKLPDETELLRLVPEVVGWLAGVEPVSAKVIAAAPALRVISRNGTGVDNLPLADLSQRGIRLCTADGANASGVAELTICLMLTALRHVPFCDAGIKAGEWPRRRGREIKGRQVGIIGCGAVGRQVARLAAALGAHISIHDPLNPEVDVPEDALRRADLATVLGESEIITLHCPAPADGRPLIDQGVLASGRYGAILINTARASLIDETAVIAALDSGELSAYATDVFSEEPPQQLTLARHPRVIATSHIGGFTEESIDRATEIAVKNLIESLKAS